MEQANTPAQVPTLSYSIEGFCEATGVGRSAAYYEIKAGRLKVVKFGRRTLIRRVDAESWLNRLAEEQGVTA